MDQSFNKIIVFITTTFLILINFTPTISADQETQDFDLDDPLFDLKIKLFMRLACFPSISVCIIKNDSIVWHKGYGKAKFFPPIKPTLDTIYPIGSISKTFTATALMQLFEQGKFDLDDNVNDYLNFEVKNPNFPNENITFRMLLAHQSSLSGLTQYTQISSFIFDLRFTYLFYKERCLYPYPLIKELITTEGYLYWPINWEDYPPGKNCSYSNFGYILLEHLVEVLSGESYTDYITENIFKPLNMTNSSFFYKDLNRKNLAFSYFNIGRVYIRLPFIDIPYGIGGIKTSMRELSHYAIVHKDGGIWNGNRILNESTVELMHTHQYPNYSLETGLGVKFGLGWGIHPGHEGHYGHVPGGSSFLIVNKTHNYSIVFSINNYILFSKPIVAFSINKIMDFFCLKAESY